MAARKKESLQQLRERVDAASRRVAEAQQTAEARERAVEIGRKHADASERELHEALSKKKSFYELVKGYFEAGFEMATWAPIAIPVVAVAVAVGIAIFGEDEPEPDFRFEAFGSVFEGESTEIALASRSDFVFTPHHRTATCHAEVHCGAVVFSDTIGCAIEERSESDGDDTTYWDALLASDPESELPRFQMDSDIGIVEFATSTGARMRVTLHEAAWEGEP